MKFFEVLDVGTRISVLAFDLKSMCEVERRLIALAGYRPLERSIIVIVLGPIRQIITPGRTMREAHLYICEHFDEMMTGDIINVEAIIKENRECT